MKSKLLVAYIILFASMLTVTPTYAVEEEFAGPNVGCYCNFWKRCKASGSGNTCAVGSPNIDCQHYNKNC